MQKTVINLLIILIWLLFAAGYFALFQANRPAPKDSAEFRSWEQVERGGIEIDLPVAVKSERATLIREEQLVDFLFSPDFPQGKNKQSWDDFDLLGLSFLRERAEWPITV